MTVAAEYRHHNRTNRASFDPRDQIVAGDAGNNAVAEPNHRWGDPDTRDVMTFVNASVPLNAAETRFLYAFGGYSRREANSAGLLPPRARRAQLAADLSARLPAGDRADGRRRAPARSASAACVSSWNYDASGQYGHNSFAFTIGDTLNVSLGPTIPPNKTEFDAGSAGAEPVRRQRRRQPAVPVGGLAGPLNVAFGAEYRRENYQIHAGEPDSYGDGGVPNQFGGRAAIGAQVFPGFRPSNEVDASRNSVAGYVDVEGDVIEWLRLGVAGRAEHYSDFGSTVDGKLTARVQPDPRFVVRGSVSTGFRAPSLGQSFFSSTATNFVNLGPGPGAGRVADAAGRLGAGAGPRRRSRSSRRTRCTPERRRGGHARSRRSTSPSTTTASPSTIASSCPATSPRRAIAALLAPFGANSARFFTNAIDTRTNGVDVTANYQRRARHRRRRAAARRLQQHAHEDRRVDRHAAAAGRLRVGAVRSHRAAAHRVRPAEGQPAARRRLAAQPVRRQPRRGALRRVLQLHAQPGRRPGLRRRSG